MPDVFATRSDWLIKVAALKGYDILTIHPLDGLTPDMVVSSLGAQKLLYDARRRAAFTIQPHGSKIMIQRRHPEESLRR